MVDIPTVDVLHEQRQGLLKRLQAQVKELTSREIKRLETERDWLKTIQRSGLDDVDQSRKETDEVLFLNEFDDLLGGS